MAAIQTLFSESGIIKDIVIEQGKITGELVGVTIKGDLIEGNTVKADKLVIKGSDGLYYKLNVDGLNNISTENASKFSLTTQEPTDWETDYKDYYILSNNHYVHVTGNTAPTWTINTYFKLKPEFQDGLDGTNILAQTITADKISVTDLVAFGATIGGYHIDQNKIFSGVKESALNTSRGVFFNDDGEFSIGDSNNYLRYYLDTDENDNVISKFEIAADVIRLGSSGKTLEEKFSDISGEMDENKGELEEQIRQANTLIDSINAMIQNLVIDENGESMMTQTGSGWVFNMSSIQESLATLNDFKDGLNLPEDINDLPALLKTLSDQVVYVECKEVNGQPQITLGATESDFKVIITNTEIDFMNGTEKPAYINGNIFYGQNITTINELKIGQSPSYIFKRRNNGNLGLMYSEE